MAAPLNNATVISQPPFSVALRYGADQYIAEISIFAPSRCKNTEKRKLFRIARQIFSVA
jgi:hypothetical protein